MSRHLFCHNEPSNSSVTSVWAGRARERKRERERGDYLLLWPPNASTMLGQTIEAETIDFCPGDFLTVPLAGF